MKCESCKAEMEKEAFLVLGFRINNSYDRAVEEAEQEPLPLPIWECPKCNDYHFRFEPYGGEVDIIEAAGEL